MRYWFLNGSLWATEWIPQAHLVVIDPSRFIDWIEGAFVGAAREVHDCLAGGAGNRGAVLELRTLIYVPSGPKGTLLFDRHVRRFGLGLCPTCGSDGDLWEQHMPTGPFEDRP